MIQSFNPESYRHQTWKTYWAAYLKWMQKTNHPDLTKSNWNADKYRRELKQAATP